MSLFANRVIPAVLVGGIAVIVGMYVAGQQRSPIMITRLYTGSDGQTHEDRMEIRLTPSTMYSEAEASEAVRVSQAQFFRLPKGKVQDWHNPTHRQYVVTLTGRGEVEIAGRQKILITPGRVILLENVTGKGHITRSTGSVDLTFFIVPLADQ
jgi:quercetin dioxygenase-like cupin family protein